MTDEKKAALYYLVVRRFGAPVYGEKLDDWCKAILKSPEANARVRSDYDRMFSEAYVD
jgi:hypothetical protein